MSGNDRSTAFRNRLLAGVSALALTVAVGAAGTLTVSHHAMAQTELDDGFNITADVPAGLEEAGLEAEAAVTGTIDSTAGAITLGADATASLAVATDADTTVAVTLNVTAGVTPSGVTFAGDITLATGDETIIINATDDNITLQGNVTDIDGGGIDFNIGSGAADPTLTMTVDTAFAESITINAAIDAVDAGDVITLAVQNTNAGANTITFSAAIGVTQQIDTINIGGDGNDIIVVFSAATDAADINIGSADGSSATVTFATTVDSTTIDIGNGGAIADTIVVNFAVAADATVTGNIEGAATDTETINITDTDNGTDDDQVNFTGTIGAGTAVDAINVGSATLSGTADFAANVTTTTLTILGGDAGAGAEDSAVFFSGTTLTAAIVLDNGSDTATLTIDGAAAQFISGAITAAADGEGIIVVANTTGNNNVTDVTFSGAIGSGAASVTSITITDGDAEFDGAVFTTTLTTDDNATADFDADVTVGAGGATINAGGADFAANLTSATTLAFGGAGTMTLDGTAAQAITGAITSTAAGQGDITVSNTGGTVTFTGALGVNGVNELNDVTLGANTTTVFQSTVDADTLSISGAVTFTAAVTLDETFTTAVGTTITLGPAFVSGTTVIVSTGSEATLNQTANAVTLNVDPLFTSGTLILVNDTNALDATDAASFNVIDTNLLIDYIVAIGTDNIVLSAIAKSANTVATELGITEDAAAALGSAFDAVAGDAQLLAIFNTILAAGGAEATLLAEQVQGSPSALTAATSVVVAAVGTRVFRLGTKRLASLRQGLRYASRQQTGFAAGNHGPKNRIWVRPFANFLDQDTRGGVAGFDADTYGVAAGLDAKFGDDDNWTAGLALSYADTDVDGKDAGRSRTDIESYQITLYADYTTPRWYVEGVVGYARNDVDTSRRLTFGGLNLTASGDFDSDQFLLGLGTGIPFKVGANHFLTPHVGFQYIHVDSEPFTETGAGVLNLTVNPDDVDIALGIVGARYHFNMTTAKGIVTPEIRGSLLYDFAGDDAQATSTFTGGGAAFNLTGTDVAELGGSMGLGLTYTRKDGVFTLGVDYDAEFKSDFIGHSARIEFKLHF